MKKINYLDSIKSPIITEKATGLSDQNKVTFRVHKDASKSSIKKNIEKIFKVKVIKINTINKKAKTKSVRGRTKSGKTSKTVQYIHIKWTRYHSINILSAYRHDTFGTP